MRKLIWTTGTRTTAGTTALVAAAASKRHHICKLIISAYAFNDTATAAIADSATTFWKILAKDGNGNSWYMDFGDEGLHCASGSAINLVTATANSSIVVTIGYWTSN